MARSVINLHREWTVSRNFEPTIDLEITSKHNFNHPLVVFVKNDLDSLSQIENGRLREFLTDELLQGLAIESRLNSEGVLKLLNDLLTCHFSFPLNTCTVCNGCLSFVILYDLALDLDS